VTCVTVPAGNPGKGYGSSFDGLVGWVQPRDGYESGGRGCEDGHQGPPDQAASRDGTGRRTCPRPAVTLGAADTGWSLVGRDAELESVLGLMCGRPASSVVLTGGVGVGKSRFALEVIRHVGSDAGVRVLWVAATEAARRLQLGAFATILPDFPMNLGGRTLLRAAQSAILAAPGARRTLLVVDDAHLLDDLSASLIHQLATSAAATLLLTTRAAAPAPDAIGALTRNGFAVRRELHPLDRQAFDHLLDVALPGAASASLRSWLWQRTEGNPLFLRELILGGRESGALSQESGRWEWDGPFTPSGQLIEVVEAALAALSPGQRETLELVAVGGSLDALLIESLTPPDDLRSLDRVGVLRVHQEGRRMIVEILNPLLAEVLQARTPPLVARELRRRLIEALRATGLRRRDDILRVGRLMLAAGITDDPQALTAAAQQAMSTLDVAGAERLARAAVEAGADWTGHLALGEVLFAQRRIEEADDLAAQLLTGSPSTAATVALTLFRASCLFSMGRLNEMEAILDDLIARHDEPAVRVAADARRAMLWFWGGRPLAALELARRLAEEPIDDPAVQVHVQLSHALAAAGAGALGDATAHATAGLVTAMEQRAREQAPTAALLLASARFFSLLWSGQAAAAEEFVAAVAQIDDVRSVPAAGAVWLLNQSELAVWRGRPRTAAHRAAESAGMLRDIDGHGLYPWALANLVVGLAWQGDLDEAAATHDLLEKARQGPVAAFDAVLDRATVALLAARGDRRIAIAAAASSAERSAARGQRFGEMLGWFDALRLGGGLDAATGLRVAAGRVDGAFSATLADLAVAWHREHGQGLSAAASRLEQLGMTLYAAEFHALAADAHRRAGDAVGAFGSRERAFSLLAECEGAQSPLLAWRLAAGELSPREQDVAILAARGLSNKEISRQLVISLRTVENHLYRIFLKLGISSRSQLSAMFVDGDHRRPLG
jgi:DNA-binding CsgD family transcriptional regulator